MIWNPEARRPIRSLADIEAIERIPFDQLTTARSAYDLIRLQAESTHGDWPAISLLPTASSTTLITLTYRQLFRRVTGAANLFHTLSAGAPPVTALMVPAIPDAHVALWGGAAAGIAMPLNFLLNVDELAALLNAGKTTVLVALASHPEIWAKATAVKDRVPTLKAIVRVENGIEGLVEADHLDRTFDFDQIAAYFHTGGTTGSPKLAQHSNRNHVAMAFAMSASWGVAPGESIINGLPVFHVGGALDAGLAALGNGAHVMLLTPTGLRNPEVVTNIWSIIERFRINNIGGVPTSIAAMLQVPRGNADLSSVKIAFTGGAPLPLDRAREFEALGIPLREVFGMTETMGNGVAGLRLQARVEGSAGVRTAYTQIKAIRPDGSDCAPDEAGLLCMRGPTVMPGYSDAKLDQGTMLDDGWLSTGDLGRVRADGHVFVTGRMKELIIRSGHNIDPAVIEGAVDAHPSIMGSAAVGMPDEYAGELPALFVKLKPGASLTVDELHEWLSERIAERPAMPKRIEIIEELPMTAVGKIYKPGLRCRLVEAVFNAKLAGVGTCVATIERSGLVATITTTDRSAVDQRLAGFTIPRRFH